MKQTLFIDPRIRDNVFIPLVVLMVLVSVLRFYVTKLMYAQDSPLLQKVQMSHKTLKKTMYESIADFSKDQAPGVDMDVGKALEDQIKTDAREGSALARSQRIRKASEYLTEDALKIRKAYYCSEKYGYLNKKVASANPLAMMGNPDMMGNMMKQNVQGMFNMFLFTVVGSLFSGFIIAQIPFPLG